MKENKLDPYEQEIRFQIQKRLALKYQKWGEYERSLSIYLKLLQFRPNDESLHKQIKRLLNIKAFTEQKKFQSIIEQLESLLYSQSHSTRKKSTSHQSRRKSPIRSKPEKPKSIPKSRRENSELNFLTFYPSNYDGLTDAMLTDGRNSKIRFRKRLARAVSGEESKNLLKKPSISQIFHQKPHSPHPTSTRKVKREKSVPKRKVVIPSPQPSSQTFRIQRKDSYQSISPRNKTVQTTNHKIRPFSAKVKTKQNFHNDRRISKNRPQSAIQKTRTNQRNNAFNQSHFNDSPFNDTLNPVNARNIESVIESPHLNNEDLTQIKRGIQSDAPIEVYDRNNDSVTYDSLSSFVKEMLHLPQKKRLKKKKAAKPNIPTETEEASSTENTLIQLDRKMILHEHSQFLFQYGCPGLPT